MRSTPTQGKVPVAIKMSGTIWQGTIHEILFVIGAAFITGVLLGTYYERRRRGVASDLNDSVVGNYSLVLLPTFCDPGE